MMAQPVLKRQFGIPLRYSAEVIEMRKRMLFLEGELKNWQRMYNEQTEFINRYNNTADYYQKQMKECAKLLEAAVGRLSRNEFKEFVTDCQNFLRSICY